MANCCVKKKKKKGQGLSLNVIVIAALALLVLVILAIIFLGRMGTTGKELSQCENKGGKCMAYCDPNSAYPTQYSGWKCDEGKVCCVPVST